MPATADELHDALLGLGFVTQDEVDRHESWRGLLDSLAAQRRATRVHAIAASASTRTPAKGRAFDGDPMWVAAERLPQFDAVYPEARMAPPIDAPAEFAERAWTRDDALLEIVRSRLEGLGPVDDAAQLPSSMGVAGQRHRGRAGQACLRKAWS